MRTVRCGGTSREWARPSLIAGWVILLTLVLNLLPMGPTALAKEPLPATSVAALDDEALIRQCLALARAAAARGDEPFGALLVKDGRIILRAKNSINTDNNVLHHAEINLLAGAYRKYGPGACHGATLYSSAEPCPMCCGAIYLSGVSRVVYGLSDERLSALSGFKGDIPSRKIFATGDRKIEVIGPVLEDEAAAVLADYLKKRRTRH